MVETLNRRTKGVVASACLAFLILTISSSAVYATRYGFTQMKTTSTVRTPTVQLQPGDVGSPTVSIGVYAAATIASSSLTLYYVPLTLTNCNTCAATPNPLQAKVTWNPSSYAAYEAANLGNIRFCVDVGCNTMLYAWIESCTSTCSTSATSASAWVRLTSIIAANGGTLTVYMVFLSKTSPFDGNYWGEAPTLSGTYGQYDNGANVFTFYDNFAGTTLSPKWTSVLSGSGATITVNNGLTVATTTTGAYGFVISAYQPYPEVAETYTTSGNSILGVSTSQLLNGFIAPYYGYSMDWYSGYDDIEYEGTASAQLAAPTEANFPTGIWQVTWSATGSEYFQDGSGVSYSGTNGGHAIANYGIYVGQSNGVIQSSLFSWARMRAYPPSNTLPSVSFGTIARGAILTFTNSGSTSWLANLVVYSSTNAARLSNLTVSFQSPLSRQVILGTAVTNQNSGPQVTLAGSATLSIILGVTVSSAGTSTVTLGLKIQTPPSPGQASVYEYCIISLTVN